MTELKKDSRRWTAGLLLAFVGLGAVAWFCLSSVLLVNRPQVQTRNELTQLSLALTNFKGKFRVYPPSRIKLCGSRSEYDPRDPLDAHSLRALSTLWPNLGDFRGVRWAGVLLPPGGVILEGDQCLVFFLGGIPGGAADVPEPRGFSDNPRDPAEDGQHLPEAVAAAVGLALASPEVGPAAAVAGLGFRPTDGPAHGKVFYGFSRGRLVRLRGSPFYSYLDPYEQQPYAYFSAWPRPNGYNPLGTTDCPALGVWPYAASLGPNPRYYQPDSFQILSAGPDGAFGPGTVLPDGPGWTPGRAGEMDPRGRDDLANFHSAPLGTPGG